MNDLISRQAAIEGTKRIPDLTVYAFCSFIDMLTNMPSAQPERKKGKWIRYADCDCLKCDQCGMPSINAQNFCCRCGADMRGEQE